MPREVGLHPAGLIRRSMYVGRRFVILTDTFSLISVVISLDLGLLDTQQGASPDTSDTASCWQGVLAGPS